MFINWLFDSFLISQLIYFSIDYWVTHLGPHLLYLFPFHFPQMCFFFFFFTFTFLLLILQFVFSSPPHVASHQPITSNLTIHIYRDYQVISALSIWVYTNQLIIFAFPSLERKDTSYQMPAWLIHLTQTWSYIFIFIKLWEWTEVSMNTSLKRFENILIRLPQRWICSPLCESLIWSNFISSSFPLRGHSDTWVTLCGGLQ